MASWSRWLPAAFMLALSTAAPAAAPAIAHVAGPGYHLYRSGPLGDVGSAPPRPGLLMMGGGDYFPAAFQWLFERAGHGRVVVLRASGGADLQALFLRDLGGIAAVDTIVFLSGEAAHDPAVLAVVRAADAIFIAGGDQSNYVNFWRGTPIEDALHAHVAAGRPLGGTSAGLAIQGAWSYGALDGGSLLSTDALADPMGPASTLVGDFLALPPLAHVITDSHFMPRERLGRLISWVVRLRATGADPDLFGIGIDEATALAVEGDGSARVLSATGGQAWVVRPRQAPSVLTAGRPLSVSDVEVLGLGTESRLQLPEGRVSAAQERWTAEVVAGVLRIDRGDGR